MPRAVITLHGSEEYRAALVELQRRAKLDLSSIAERALNEWAQARHGIYLPPRARPVGANQHNREVQRG